MTQLGHQQTPEELIFAVRRDGQLVFRSYDPEQEVKGFARRVLGDGGAILSAVAIPSEDGSTDEIWALCEWGGARSVQRMASWWEVGTAQADACFLDDALSDSLDVASDTISGLEHLAGVEVSILADGGVCNRQVVPGSGIITIEYPAFKRTVGRGYTARMRMLRAELKDPTGQTAQGKIKKLVSLVLRIIDTAGVLVNAGSRNERLLDRPNNIPMDAAAPLVSGDTDGRTIGGDYGRDGQYEILSDDPLPCFILAAMPRFDVSAR